MDRKYTYNILEFNKILALVSNQAQTSLGKEVINSLEAISDFSRVNKLLDITDEAYRILTYSDSLIFPGKVDIYNYLDHVDKDGYLQAIEFVDIVNHISIVKRIVKYHRELKVSDINYFDSIVKKISLLEELEEELSRCIDGDGSVRDSANVEIRKLRKSIVSRENEVKNKINQIMTSKKSMLSEHIVTVRNNRQVLAVKAEYKHVFGGLIHDESISGQTVYIEPDECVSLNNSVVELRSKLNNEIEKLLRYLSSFVKNRCEDIKTNLYVIKEIDVMFAKAKYAKMIDGYRIKISDEKFVNLINARHPLIDKGEVIENNIVFKEDIMVITGANTGGKTITLKTVGLFALMNQVGLFVSCHRDSCIPIFDKVFTQMGDNQSLENNLSTFSSHILDLKFILENASKSSLVLLDEVGNGTNPNEGSALAIAILEELHERGSKVVATTHYNELKEYAASKDYVLSASVRFDTKKLTPTYKLILNSSGLSYALMISERLGISKNIVDNASNILENNLDKNMNLIEKLNEQKIAFEEEKADFEEEKKAFNKIKSELELKVNEVEQSGEKIIQRAKNEANKIIDEALKQSQIMMNTLSKEQKHHELLKGKKLLEDAKHKEEEMKKQSAKEIIVGDEVLVLPFESKAVVTKKISDNEYEIAMGSIKSVVKKDNLIFNYRSAKTKTVSTSVNVNKSVNTKLDLRGLRVEEARIELESYLDKVKLSKLPYVTIVHGYGTGAVRNMVIDYLKSKRYSFRAGGAGEGGSGATVIEFE